MAPIAQPVQKTLLTICSLGLKSLADDNSLQKKGKQSTICCTALQMFQNKSCKKTVFTLRFSNSQDLWKVTVIQQCMTMSFRWTEPKIRETQGSPWRPRVQSKLSKATGRKQSMDCCSFGETSMAVIFKSTEFDSLYMYIYMLLYWQVIWQTPQLRLKHRCDKPLRSCASMPTPQEKEN